MSSNGGHHITPFKTYISVFTALIVLTVITVAVAQVDLGAWNMFVAMLVASVKATLVLLWFMHLKYENNLNRVVFASGFFFLIIMFAFCAIDIFSRGNFSPENFFGQQ